MPESSIIIEYLAKHYPGKSKLVPADEDLARQTRLSDRFFDLYVHMPMQRIVAERLRPAGKGDPFGLEQAKTQLQTALGMVERDMAAKTWAMGDAFTMADCAASPALFYADQVIPFGDSHKNAAAYLSRLKARPVLRAGAQGSAALLAYVSEVTCRCGLARRRRPPLTLSEDLSDK